MGDEREDRPYPHEVTPLAGSNADPDSRIIMTSADSSVFIDSDGQVSYAIGTDKLIQTREHTGSIILGSDRSGTVISIEFGLQPIRYDPKTLRIPDHRQLEVAEGFRFAGIRSVRVRGLFEEQQLEPFPTLPVETQRDQLQR